MARIYLSPPHMGDDERRLLLEAFDSGWIAPLGEHVDGFEADMTEFLGGGHAVALASGTAALHLALLALNVPAGSEVIAPTLTFVATVNAIRHAGCTPTFVDADPASWNIDTQLLAEVVKDRVRAGGQPGAVIVVDLYGQCADLDAVHEVCRPYGIPVIEDAAEALGATYKGRPAGTLADVGVLSFNGNKIITTSGGGMLVSADPAVADRVRHLATQARLPFVHYEHDEVGFNYRLSNLLAAIGRGQLRTLDEKVARTRAINARYRAALADVDGIAFMPHDADGEPSWWLTCITIDPDRFGADRDAVMASLEELDIESRPTWKPMHQQPAHLDCEVIGGRVADAIFDRGLCLPSGTNLGDADVDRVAQAITAVPDRRHQRRASRAVR